jgi:hypothetical protein
VKLGCTLLIEIEDPAVRAKNLQQWWDLPEKIYVQLEDGTRIHARFDERQRGEGRLSSVQYLKFDTGARVPVAAGVDLPEVQVETPLSEEQKRALRTDLTGLR